MTIDPDQLEALRKRVALLSQEQRDRLLAQLEAQGIDGSWLRDEPGEVSLSISKDTRPSRIALTSSQSHVWVLHQLYPKLTAYHIPFAWRFEGPLDVKALNVAFERLLERHSALRTIFVPDDDGRPWQELLPAKIPELTPVSVGGNGFCAATAAAVVAKPFELSCELPIRAQLQRISEDAHVLVIVLHHLVADGWSRGVLIKDLAAGYGSAIGRSIDAGQRNAGINVSDQDAAFSLDQIAYSVHLADEVWRESEDYADQLQYWKRHLSGISPIELPMGRTRSGVADFRAETTLQTFSPSLADSLKELGQASGATLFMTLMAAFKLLLYRYTGQHDLAVGVPVAGRRHVESADLIGFFVNTVVLRTKFGEHPQATFGDWLQQVKSTVVESLQYQHVSFSEVVDACAPKRRVHGNPFFEIMFQVQGQDYRVQNADAPDVSFPDLKLTQQHIELPETKFDLAWHMFDRAEGLLLAVEFRSAIFQRKQIERMMEHFHHLLTEIVADPDKKIGEYSLVSDDERSRILGFSGLGNRDRLAKPESAVTFPGAFTHRFLESPEAVAIRFEDQEYTYRELDARSTVIAQSLLEAGAQAGDVVAIQLPRTFELVATIIGAMKAGVCYLPIDLSQPAERSQLMQRQAGCTILVDPQGIHRKFVQPEGAAAGEVGRLPNPNEILPESDAYVIFTSGSTGVPKGAVVRHSSLMNYLAWCISTYPFDEGWGAPVQTSIGFDATITSLLAPLVVGKTVHLLSEDNELEQLAEIVQTGPSVVKLTPAHLSALSSMLPTNLGVDCLPAALVVGGEALTAEHVAFWMENYPDVQVFNEYGPTETVVGCCVQRVGPEHHDAHGLPIGRPIWGTVLYVLDESMQPTPLGVPGELFIGGAGVARGYIDQPSLSAERFVPNPFNQPGPDSGFNVLYRTGDLVRYRDDGLLEFLGRNDDQVQIRGYRIETSEVETVIRRQGSVLDCVVIATDSSGTPAARVGPSEAGPVATQLVAYVQTVDERDPREELFAILERELPHYMIPRHIELLDSLPLTAQGKVDRRALPVPSAGREPNKMSVPPRSELEVKLLAIWKNVLNQEDLGVEDNFFERGGDSITAMQIVAGARRAGLRFEPRQLFEHQTIAAQAVLAAEYEGSQADVVPPSWQGDVPLSPMQRAFFDLDPIDPHHFNQGILLSCLHDLDQTRLKDALQIVHDQHGAFRLRFERDSEGNWRQWYSENIQEVVSMETVDLRESIDIHTDMKVALSEHQTRFDLGKGPLFRAVLIQCPNNDDRLLLLAHHLIVDGLSWAVVLGDLDDVYQQIGDTRTPKLPVETSRYADWIVSNWGTSQPAIVGGPDRSSSGTWGDVGTFEVKLALRDNQEISESILVTALSQSFSQMTRQETIDLTVERHGRDSGGGQLDLSRTVGWFTLPRNLKMRLPSSGIQSQFQYVESCLKDTSTPNGTHADFEQPFGEIGFNYLGTIRIPPNSIASGLAPEPIPDLNSPRNPRWHSLELIAWRTGHDLHLLWRFRTPQYSRDTIERLADRFLAAVHSLHAVGTKASLAEGAKSGQGIDKLMAKLNSRGK